MTVDQDILWWISVVELPVLTGLFWLIWRTRQEGERRLADAEATARALADDVRADLAAYKVEVAKTYASVAYLNSVEKRLIEHLLRIEGKLDRMPWRLVEGQAGDGVDFRR